MVPVDPAVPLDPPELTPALELPAVLLFAAPLVEVEEVAVAEFVVPAQPARASPTSSADTPHR
jgi:hypothetical protein